MRSSPRQQDVAEALKVPADALPEAGSPIASGHFRLTRYFSWVSLGLIAAVGLLLTLSMRAQMEREMIHMAERRNEAMTAVFIHALGERLAPLLQNNSGPEPAQLLAQSEAQGLHARARALMFGADIIKIKLYNRQGLTVYSSSAAQIGEDKRDNPGFQAALAGRTTSALVHRDNFDAFEGQRAMVDLISSYLPLPAGPGQLEAPGVIELYQDVTPFVQRLAALHRRTVLAGFALMLGLYGLQLLLVQRAQGILRRQEAALQEVNRVLDQRVQSRTEELRAALARLEHLAHHDPLTGLPNRLLCNDHLRYAIAKAQRQQRQLAVLFLDLDQFKEVNDMLGHSVGDDLLIEVARRLAAHLRGSDLLARLGGDEFVCVLECENAALESPLVADKLIQALSRTMELQGHEVQISASIGIALYPGDGGSADELARAADTAMYEAKRAGRNRFHFYRPEMTQAALARAHMDRLLRRSLECAEISVHYQSKFLARAPGVPTGGVGPCCGVEALARWHSAELGAVPPARFIALAEESGFINELGAWMLRRACEDMMAWRSAGLALDHVSVNVSVRQLERGDFVDLVQATLAATGLPASALELEITESVIMNADNALATLNALHGLGVQLSIDDFGTGYSSLAYLKLLPIQTLKIDRSFVAGIGAAGRDTGDRAIIEAVIGLARSLGLNTVAEGVESPEQLAVLQTLDCAQVQGFLFSRPVPAEQVQLDCVQEATSSAV
ncbi:EAL domain-containing protein [Paucibacter sp. DJ1R-11]|uniref:putative bifunctional diguanylate cyclase/phosphodiesterase n=1 Tax=Paucibacter sp. DJ1R-11 TaxID=2893556 RepID=UPI0021E47768|nr:EAL domain-containing protein [Paucibacter sp. DJ1R-11]MCV2365963.1 EAL domain-containing protein [Paucibacter sp. DJ1R-11]